MTPIDYRRIRPSTQRDLCAMAIMRTAEALSCTEGREAVQRGKEAYLRHIAEMNRNKEAHYGRESI